MYRISPSLMNAFGNWLNASEIYERYWGSSNAPALTEQEFVEKQKAELLAYINKEPQPLNEAADRGTCLNEIVDCLIGAEPNPSVWWDKVNGDYEAERNGFHFVFDAQLVEDIQLFMRNGIPQYHLSNVYSPAGCNYSINLHGYADYIFPTQIWDLKTTNKYEGEKYMNNWQRFVYPVIALDREDMMRCDFFGFYAVECHIPTNGTKIIGRAWKETYDVNIADMRSKIMEYLTTVLIPQLDRWHDEGLTPNQTICEYE